MPVRYPFISYADGPWIYRRFSVAVILKTQFFQAVPLDLQTRLNEK